MIWIKLPLVLTEDSLMNCQSIPFKAMKGREPDPAIDTKCRVIYPTVSWPMTLVDLEGIEPTTYCVQGNRSPN